MKTKGTLIGRFLIGLLLVAAASLATAEMTRGSGQAGRACVGCGTDFWCEVCCGAAGSVCLRGGQCLCM